MGSAGILYFFNILIVKHLSKSGSELKILKQANNLTLKYCQGPFMYLDNIDEDVDGSIHCQHEMIPFGQNLGPGRPVNQFSVVENLI